jgi:hypothetical protein
MPDYALTIDGPQFRQQRSLLLKISAAAHHGTAYVPEVGDADLLEGMVSLTDAIADQAHDRYGLDGLLADKS